MYIEPLIACRSNCSNLFKKYSKVHISSFKTTNKRLFPVTISINAYIYKTIYNIYILVIYWYFQRRETNIRVNRYIALCDPFQVKTMIRYLKTAFHTFTDYCLTYDIMKTVETV